MQESQGEFSTYLSLAKDLIEEGDYEQALGCFQFAFEAFKKIGEDVIDDNLKQDLWLDVLIYIYQINFSNISDEIKKKFLEVLTAIGNSDKFSEEIQEKAVNIYLDMSQNYNPEYDQNPTGFTAMIDLKKVYQEHLEEQPKLTPNEIKEKIQSFLSTVSKRYVDAMRVCAEDQKDPLWGGDIELIEIAKILQVQIVIHKNEIGKCYSPFGDINSKQTIHLLLMGENYGIGHYCLLIPNEQNGFDRKGITADGDCLFNACLAGKRQLDAPTEPFSQSTSQEIRALRNEVCDNLEKLLENISNRKPRVDAETVYLYTEHDDPIKARFSTIIDGEENNLSANINALPHSNLVNEALELRNLLAPPQINYTPESVDSPIWEKKPSKEKRKRSFIFSDSDSDSKSDRVKQKRNNDPADNYLNKPGGEIPNLEDILGEKIEGNFSWASKK